MGDKGHGIDQNNLTYFSKEIKKVISETNIQIAIVIGGGNIYRGIAGAAEGMDRTQGDYMGMLATVINSLALQSSLESMGVNTKLFSGFQIGPVSKLMSGKAAIEELDKGNVCIISGGTGNPYFTTDTASVLRALEIKADHFLKGTRVDGIFTADPEKDRDAEKYLALTFDEAIDKDLKVMDLTAFTMCKENNLPIIVFNMNLEDNLLKLLQGEAIGTIVN